MVVLLTLVQSLVAVAAANTTPTPTTAASLVGVAIAIMVTLVIYACFRVASAHHSKLAKLQQQQQQEEEGVDDSATVTSSREDNNGGNSNSGQTTLKHSSLRHRFATKQVHLASSSQLSSSSTALIDEEGKSDDASDERSDDNDEEEDDAHISKSPPTNISSSVDDDDTDDMKSVVDDEKLAREIYQMVGIQPSLLPPVPPSTLAELPQEDPYEPVAELLHDIAFSHDPRETLKSLKQIWLLYQQWHITAERAAGGGRRLCAACFDTKVKRVMPAMHTTATPSSDSGEEEDEDGLHLLQRLSQQVNLDNDVIVDEVKSMANQIFTTIVPMLWSK